MHLRILVDACVFVRNGGVRDQGCRWLVEEIGGPCSEGTTTS